MIFKYKLIVLLNSNCIWMCFVVFLPRLFWLFLILLMIIIQDKENHSKCLRENQLIKIKFKVIHKIKIISK